MKTSLVCLTGTHLTPATALAEELNKHSWKAFYLGRNSLAEQQQFKDLSVPIYKIIAPKFNRHQALNLFFSIFKLPIGMLQSLYFLIRLKPSMVISFGGYTAFPVCLTAKLLRLPLIIHEQTLDLGLTNKLTALLATKIAYSWPSSLKHFPKNKSFLTGNPVRQAFLKSQSKTDKPLTEKPALKTIYITGGNQGSLILNKTLNPILKTLLKKYKIIHQFGLGQSKKNWKNQEKIYQNLPASLKSNYQLKTWYSSSEASKNLNTADLVISRAGINTVTELIILNKKSLLIPLPYSQRQEQLKNARLLKSLGLGLILPQSNLSSQSLLSSINKSFKSLPQKTHQHFDSSLIRQAATNLFNLIKLTLDEQKN